MVDGFEGEADSTDLSFRGFTSVNTSAASASIKSQSEEEPSFFPIPPVRVMEELTLELKAFFCPMPNNPAKLGRRGGFFPRDNALAAVTVRLDGDGVRGVRPVPGSYFESGGENGSLLILVFDSEAEEESKLVE